MYFRGKVIVDINIKYNVYGKRDLEDKIVTLDI